MSKQKIITDIGSIIPEEFVLSEKELNRFNGYLKNSAAQKGKAKGEAAKTAMALAKLGKPGVKFAGTERAKKIATSLTGRKRTITWGDKLGESRQKSCTVDGITIYPSRKALMAALGKGKAGSRSPNFRYI